MNFIEGIHKFHQQKVGNFIFMLLELGLSYAVASRAIYTGSWWEYLIAFIFLVGALKNLINVINR